MTDLRNLCRCSHVRSSHIDGGPCRNTCGCQAWFPAYPVFDVMLPAGVEPVVFYPSTGLTVVDCSHRLPRDHSWCPFCFAEPWMTDGFTVAVQRLVFAPQELRLL